MSRQLEKYEVQERNEEDGLLHVQTVEAIDLVELFSKLLDRYTMASHIADPLLYRGGQIRITRVG